MSDTTTQDRDALERGLLLLVWRDPLYLVGYGTTLGDSGEIEGD